MYTADAVLVDIVYHAGSNVDVPPGMLDCLTDSETNVIRRGSKNQLAAWYTYNALVWCMKFMLLFLYRRSTMGTFQARLIKYLFWICAVTYVAVFLTITLGCFPQVVALGLECRHRSHDSSCTDPMLWRLKVPLPKKPAIGGLLSSGLFVITAAVVREVLTLGAKTSGLNINRWGIRETIVGILTVNLPILRPMFHRSFLRRRGYGSDTGPGKSSWGSRGRSNKSGYGQGTYELRSTATSKESAHDSGDAASNGSQGNIIKKDSNDMAQGVVVIEQTHDVRSHRRDEEDGLRN
ncbi:hypothetical protein BCR34DRAFT_633053 [Clohesyomyces aquaticus]|uniref:Rhodopsin domain-containing protein n=1 Tax=Clohesyomyces aquaticus TaxID=1231657 RepID=A0A1Y1Z526_9PLEO|nr:hypothetical protein BCR34DRAFT_633053 [Clohesyomyces aquaticus]